MQYEVLIKKDGTVIAETIDAVGCSCDKVIKPLVVKLGRIVSDEQKPEYDYQPSRNTTSISY